MAEPISIQQLKDASEDAISLAEFINEPENVMIPRRLASDINSLQYYLEYMKSFAQRSYETYDEMVANASNLSENVSVFVTNDSDTSKNGIYTYNGDSFVKGDYQPENAAKDYVEAKLGGLQVFDGKVRAQDVSTADGGTQDVKNTEFRNELDALPFEGGVLADTFVTKTVNGVGSVARTQRDKNADSISVNDFGATGTGEFVRAFIGYADLDAVMVDYPWIADKIPNVSTTGVTATDAKLNKIRQFIIDDYFNGSTDWLATQLAIRHAESNLHISSINFNGSYYINNPTFINRDGLTIEGNGASIKSGMYQAWMDSGDFDIVTGFVIPWSRGRGESIFYLTGSVSYYTTQTTSEFIDGRVTLSVANATSFRVGQVIAVKTNFDTRNLAKVLQVNGNDITVDRPCSNSSTANASVHTMHPIKNVTVRNFIVDFNGTDEEQRHGTFVTVNYGENVLIENIAAEHVSTGVIRLNGSLDTTVRNVACMYAHDVALTGGHGNVVKIAVSNDCLVENVRGGWVRHTVDCTGSSRNTIRNCNAYSNYSSSFTTHYNECHYNVWENNNAYYTGAGAYSIYPVQGDEHNVINGGIFHDCNLVRGVQSRGLGTQIRGVTVHAHTKYPLADKGFLRISDSHFKAHTPLITQPSVDPANPDDIEFNNCTFDLHSSRALGGLLPYSSSPTHKYVFKDCVFNMVHGYTVFEGNTNTELSFINCRIIIENTALTVEYPVFVGGFKKLEFIGSYFEYTEFEGNLGRGLYAITTGLTELTLRDNTFVNMRHPYFYARGGSTSLITVGRNTLIGGTVWEFQPNVMTKAEAGLTVTPALETAANALGGKWTAGSTIMFDKPWKGYYGAYTVAGGFPTVWNYLGTETPETPEPTV